jgi:murein DD-endopeptidase MepM/ murein hydrolase activator NlpD
MSNPGLMVDENKKESLWQRLQHTYRLVIMNNDTFEEVGSYRLSLLTVYVMISTAMVAIAILVISAIVFTPLKRYIPGYADVGSNPRIIELNQELDSLTAMVESQRIYTESFRKMLVGEVETLAEVPEQTYQPGDSALAVERIEEDERLRREVELEEIREIAQMTKSTNFNSREIPLEQLYFTAPLTGEISAQFDVETKHMGVDIMAPKNTAVKSALDGWVVFSDWTAETGNTIGIQHANNIITFYKHNSVLLKDFGSFVKAGEAVAIIGNTGTLTDGPHLHFEIWHKGMPVDPAEYVNFN